MDRKFILIILLTIIAGLGIGWSYSYNNISSQLTLAGERLYAFETSMDYYKESLNNVQIDFDKTLISLNESNSTLEELYSTINKTNTILANTERNLKEQERLNDSLIFTNKLLNKDSEAYRKMQSGFSTREELQEWLDNNHINENNYNSSYNCENFSKDLAKAAKSDGYYLGLLEVLVPRTPSLFSVPPLMIKGQEYPAWYKDYELHAKCFAIIGNSIWEIEPQTDEMHLLSQGVGW